VLRVECSALSGKIFFPVLNPQPRQSTPDSGSCPIGKNR
jgi:hypothetical protein